jgi:thymidylate synthase
MQQYREIVTSALAGERRIEGERTNAGTIGQNIIYKEWDLNERFPVPTIRPIAWKMLLGETLSFLHGDTNIREFLNRKSTFWTPDAMRHNYNNILESGLMTEQEIKNAQAKVATAKEVMLSDLPADKRCFDANELLSESFELMKRYENEIKKSNDFAKLAGDMGPIYGAVWNGKYPGAVISQLAEIEKDLKKGGNSRRNIFSGWQPDLLKSQALPPCHLLTQILVRPESKKLDLGMYQRSADTILGVIHNIPQYGLIAQIFAHTHGYKLGKLGITFGDYHVYIPHIPIAKELLERPIKTDNARLEIKVKRESITQYEPEDFELVGYQPHEKLPYRIPMFGGLF